MEKVFVVVLNVRVTTGSKEFGVEGFNEWTGELRVRLKSSPEKGKANKELVGALSDLFGTEVVLLSGSKSTKKKLMVKGESMESIKNFLIEGETK